MKMEDLPGRVYVDGNTATPYVQEKKQRQVAQRKPEEAPRKQIRKRGNKGRYEKATEAQPG